MENGRRAGAADGKKSPATTASIDSLSLVGGTVFFRGGDLGGIARVRFGAAPTTIGGIVPGLFTAPVAGNAATSFAVYDSTTDAQGVIGVRALRAAEMVAGTTVQNPANGGVIPDTAHFLATQPATATGAVNALSTLTIDATGRLDGDGRALSRRQFLWQPDCILLPRDFPHRPDARRRTVAGRPRGFAHAGCRRGIRNLRRDAASSRLAPRPPSAMPVARGG